MTVRFQVSDMFDPPGQTRPESGTLTVAIALAAGRVEGDVIVDAVLRSLSDGVIVRGTASTSSVLICNRCTTEWAVGLEVPFEQVFRVRPDDEEDEAPVEAGGWIDLEPVVHDEVALAIPMAPLCRADCLGLCPTCGTDLNTGACGGHGDVSDSPFAALKQLFET